jgi:hypothetical protein
VTLLRRRHIEQKRVIFLEPNSEGWDFEAAAMEGIAGISEGGSILCIVY